MKRRSTKALAALAWAVAWAALWTLIVSPPAILAQTGTTPSVYIWTQAAGINDILAYKMNFTGGIDRSCSSGVCAFSLNGVVYTDDDSIVPSTMNKLPTTGSWNPTGTITVNQDRLQVNADADSANDPVRKSMMDAKHVGRFCIGVGAPVNGDIRYGPLWWSGDPTATLTNLRCILTETDAGSPTAAITVEECTDAAASCGTSRVSEAITCDNDGANDDGTIGNAAIDGPAQIRVSVGTVGANVTSLTVCGRYTY